ncbi:ABC transporter substrate-binding protein [Rhodococcus sp. ARC_M6]|uniref:ABC transporter substrate-binding protein n=1 Tax=Rhodococcus sp. ARC_M6 TaxID=2928852 RepID=UPI001FB33D3E|nr:extracellular solute-binding protein [Rhodococcus sp. ARC_M6]MCJ0906780.1 extracellular solute-binding protein [Rhodococcus sp. ARC_M6]
MKSFVRTLVALSAAAAMVGISGCSSSEPSSHAVDGSWEEVVAAANKEGKVMLYSSQKPANLDALKVAFHAEYPEIELEYVRGTDPDINPRVETENKIGKGTADVHMLTDASWIQTAAKSGAYSSELVGPALQAPEFDAEASVLDNRFFLTSAAVFAIGWNTDAVPNGLTSPQDIINPAFRGKIGIVNPVGIASYVDMYRHFSSVYGEDYWDKLAALQPRIYPSALGVAQALTSGEIVASPSVQPLVTEVNADAPVNWVLPARPWGTPWYTHVLKTAPHPNAAQVLANFLVTVEGQTALNDGYAAALPNIPGAVARAQDIALPNPENLTPAKVEQYSQQWQKLFQ